MSFENERDAVLLAGQIHKALQEANAKIERLTEERDEARALHREWLDTYKADAEKRIIERLREQKYIEEGLRKERNEARMELARLRDYMERELLEYSGQRALCRCCGVEVLGEEAATRTNPTHPHTRFCILGKGFET